MENCAVEMKNYIGVKIIQAKPMTRGDYNIYRGWDIPVDENADDPGYLVKYSDTYESWSPKDVFESAYFEMDQDSTKITQDMVERFRGPVDYETFDEKTTHAFAYSQTGFVQHEVSSCVDPANYDEAVGVEICTEKINNTFWLCLGFVLQWARNGLAENKNE